VAFVYEMSPMGLALRQAEVLQDLIEYRAVGIDGREGLEYLIINHAAVVILSQDCDLEQDCALRFPADAEASPAEEIELHANSLAHVLLCDAYSEPEIRNKLTNFGSSDWKRVKQNQNERYHSLDAAQVGTNVEATVDAI